MKHARILHNGQPIAGVVMGDGATIRLETGETVATAQAEFLPPVQPGKIIACHLSYKSRCVEYKMKRIPQFPSY